MHNRLQGLRLDYSTANMTMVVKHSRKTSGHKTISERQLKNKPGYFSTD